ncbi:MAG: imidazole glycerol phosphate synthase subunit HisH [Methylococcales bacterium]
MSSVVVIDYGMGNLHSIAKALQFVAPESTILVSADPDTIRHADRVVFPGVGAIRDCMVQLENLDLIEAIKNVSKQKPFLGICLGLQALLESSEESGAVECLGLLQGTVVRFENCVGRDGNPLKIPHMGWNAVLQTHPHPLWSGIPQNSRFYFVHSYHAETADTACIAATADYPGPFTCAIARDNLFAVQFHPEKSQAMGLQLLRNFTTWDGHC